MKKNILAVFLLLSLFSSLLSAITAAPVNKSAESRSPGKNYKPNNDKRKQDSAKRKSAKTNARNLVKDKPRVLRVPSFDFKEEENEDPDVPSSMRDIIGKAEYLRRRGGEIAKMRGIEEGKRFDVAWRVRAIEKMEEQEARLAARAERNQALKDSFMAPWVSLGPAPIPNGQTDSVTTAVSGRVTAIDVHPTNPDIAYVGTAQGGLYRTLDGGANWTALMDLATSLSIGAIAINPLNPTIVFVGTGEGNLSLDSYSGVGLYRIDNADTAPVINGPFTIRVAGTGTVASNGIAFTNTAITKIVVDPTDANRIFVGNTIGIGGLSGTTFPTGGTNGFIGLYFSLNALSANITFSRVGSLPGGGANSVTDIVFEPGSNNNMLVGTVDFGGGGNSGVYRTTNAATASAAASPTFMRTLNLTQFQALGTVLAINKIGSTVTAVAAYQGATGSGQATKSIDGGATWSVPLAAATGFCSGQCAYDTAVAMDPDDANYIYLGGQASPILTRSTDGGLTFNPAQQGLHADSHAITLAPSSPAIAYTGNDGGIYRTSNIKAVGNVTWNSLNNSQFLATQFMSLDTHPSNANFSLGGTQDNGTNLRDGTGTWTRADFGDGGYAVIDQNATNTTNVTMYHTYFNLTNAMGYGRVTNTGSASDGNWTLYGCGFGGSTANGMTCTASAIRFYAPMERGPGNPNTLYFGSDVLYRSSNSGVTMTKVSQEPIESGVAISAIGIAPSNDIVRIVGLENGALFGTTTGATTLVDMDPANAIPNSFIARAAIDPTNANTAYVTLSAYNVTNIYKTTTLNSLVDSLAPTWTAANGGLPQVPVNAFVIDPSNTNTLYAGTDIGVYASTDGGANWTPFGTGLPRVAVFDMAFAGLGASRVLRIATHGKGLYEIDAAAPTAAHVEVSGRVLGLNGRALSNARVSLISPDSNVRTVVTGAFGYFRFDGVEVGQTYIIDVSSKRFTFAPQTVSVNEPISNLEFAPQTGNKTTGSTN